MNNLPLNAERLNPKPRDANDPTRGGMETAGGNVRRQTVAGPAEPTGKQGMRLVGLSGVLDFWEDPREDIYTLDDGEAV